MDVHLQTVEASKDSTDNVDLLQENNSFSVPNAETIKEVNSEISKGDSRELEKPFDNTEEDDHHQLNKNLNVREIHETSPFKQAVKGFVLSKLSKKVGTSHILSGLTEKIVKKLEDKDNSQSVSVHSSESDLSLSNLKIKEVSTEDISSSVSCELKSVVANDLALSESLSIEDAMECVEELKSSDDSITVGLNISERNDATGMVRSNSISLPSSPVHRFTKRASSISYSSDNDESPKKFIHSHNLTFLCEENKDNESDNKSKKSKLTDEIELKDISTKKFISSNDSHGNSGVSYPDNIYFDVKEDMLNYKVYVRTWSSSILRILKNAYHTLSLTHFFLLAAIIIHNIRIIPFILTIMFDTVVIAYICYSYICALVQKPISNKSSNASFIDPHLGNSSIRVQKAHKLIKTSVKLLKGVYDPENIKNNFTELVDISIENSCLKISPKKKKDVQTNLHSFHFLDITGATVSTFPKDLSRRRIWNKRYPICIIFPSTYKHLNMSDDFNNTDSASAEYLSTFYDDSSDIKKRLCTFLH